MNLVSLLILPAIINLQDNDGARFAIAGVALVVLIGAIAFSKRKAEAMDADVGRPTVRRPPASGSQETPQKPLHLDRRIMDLGDEDPLGASDAVSGEQNVGPMSLRSLLRARIRPTMIRWPATPPTPIPG